MAINSEMILIWVKSKMLHGMKRIISNVMLVAAAAMAFFACQKQETFISDASQERLLTITSEKPTFVDKSRTEWNGETIQWSVGDRISVAYTLDGVWKGQYKDGEGYTIPKLYKSKQLGDDTEVANFDVSVDFKGADASAKGKYVFYGVYPAPQATDFPNAPEATLEVPKTQTPEPNSFDGNSDLMIGVSVDEYSVWPTENVSMLWTRLVAHANITLKALNGADASEQVLSIKLTAQDDAKLVGNVEVNLLNNEVRKDNASNVIELNGSNLAIDEDRNIEFWACLLPEKLTSLTVVVETNKATYTRDITGISNKTFTQNARNTLAINMSTAERVEKVATAYYEKVTSQLEDWSGKYLIVFGNNAHATQDNKDLKATVTVAIEGDKIAASDDYANAVMTVTKVGSKYNMSFANGKYLAVKHNSTSSSSDPFELDFEYTDAGVKISGEAINNNVTSTYFLYKNDNNGNPLYRFYVDKSGNDDYAFPTLYRLSESNEGGGETPEQPTTPVLTVEPSVIEVEAVGGDEEVTYTVTNSVDEGVVTATTDVDWISNFEYTVANKVTFSVKENTTAIARTATITLAYTGAESKTVTVKQAAASQGGGSEGGETTETWTLVTDASTLAVGDKIVIVASGNNNYALGPQANSNRTGKSVTKSGNTVEISDEIQVIELQTGSAPETFAFYTGEAGYLYAASSSANQLKTKTELDANGSWSVSIASDGLATVTANGDKTRNLMRFNPNNGGSPLFACYASTSTTGVLVSIYKLVGGSSEGGGETPEPKVLESIAVSGATTNYVVGNEFKKPTVTAKYNDATTADVTASATFSGYDMAVAGTYTVTVSYTEGEETVTATYQITVVESQNLPEGIASIKSKATSTNDTEFAVVLTDAVVTYVSGSNAYIEDAEAGILIYKSGHGLAAGDKLNGVVSGKVKLYKNLREITSIDYSEATRTTGADVPVTVLTLAQLNADGAYDKYENMRVKVTDATVSETRRISQGDQTYALYFKGQSLTGFDLYNIIDVIGYPSKFDDAIQFNVWENAVVKGATKTTITGISDVTVKVNETTVINAVASSGAKVTYVSGNSAIATVDEDGTVTGVAEGETTITVSVPAYNGYPAAEEVCNVTVTAASQGGGDEPEQPTTSTASIDFTKLYTSNTTLTGLSFDIGDATLTFGSTGNTKPQYYANGTAVRFYGNNEMTISSSKKIVKIVFTFTTKPTSSNSSFTPGSFDYNTSTWTGETTSILIKNTASSGHWRFSKIEVTYQD